MPLATTRPDAARAPAAAEVAKAETLVKGVFKAEYDSNKTADKVALAMKLLQEAPGTASDAARYVMLRDARNIAARAGNAVLALQAAEVLASGYQVSPGKSRATVAELVVLAGMSAPAAIEATEALSHAVEACSFGDERVRAALCTCGNVF